MVQFLNNLLTASIHGSVVILAVTLLRLMLRRTPKKYICLLWLLAGIRLLLPIEIRSDLSLQPEFTLPSWDLPAILPWIWGAVAVCFGIYSLISYMKLKTKVREAVRIRGGWECDKIDTAFILGFIKPRIYIPMGMNRQSRNHILAHERTHLDKGDHWIKLIGFLALALHWFNPLVWIAYILLCRDIEMACDERVVQFMELEERKSYSAALLSCSSRQMHFAASPVAFGEVSVKQRILSILNYKKPGFWISALGVVAFFFVAGCLLTSPAQEPVVVEVPVAEFTENSTQEISDTVARLNHAWENILSGEKYHLFFADETYDGSVGWQTNIYRDGSNTLWKATDHMTEEGGMVLDGDSYKYIEGQDGGWLPCENAQQILDTMLAQFDLERLLITDIVSQTKSNDLGAYEELTYRAHSTDEAGETVTRPVTVFFDTDGNMTGMRIANADRKGADIFSFSNWTGEADHIDKVFQIAGENILDPETVHPSLLEEPTQDEQHMKEWGILFRVDDDQLTQYGSEVWFCQAEGYDMAVHTDNQYWLEKQTETGWERLEMIAEPQWEAANYVLGQGMYTMIFVDWSKLYGPLPSGIYRMGKNFAKMDNGSQTCIGYAEFEIFQSSAGTEDQTAAVERCYAELEELKRREHIHYLSTSETYSTTEVWWNEGDYLYENRWFWADAPGVTKDENGQVIPRVSTLVRLNGVGYQHTREIPGDLSSPVVGMELVTLSPDRAGWNGAEFAECLDLIFFERTNKTISFPEGVGIVSDRLVRFQQTWAVEGLDVSQVTAQLTYRFDADGNLCYMEYQTDSTAGVISIEIFDTTAEEIDAKIKPYTENLIVDTFSWEEARAAYTGDSFSIREENFVNNGGSSVTGPVEAARLALKEYPQLGEYLSVDVFRDETAGMWKVTVEAYVDYQSTYCYRDVYLSDSGETRLLVYEGPVGYDEKRQ